MNSSGYRHTRLRWAQFMRSSSTHEESGDRLFVFLYIGESRGPCRRREGAFNDTMSTSRWLLLDSLNWLGVLICVKSKT